jgi:hypothetical protein
MKTNVISLLAATIFFAAPFANAGHFFSDFNNGLPPDAKVNGDASVERTGGVDDTGMLKLTTTNNCWIGSFFLEPLDGRKAVTGFTAKFKALIGGGTGADGLGFHFGEFPDERIGEYPFTNELTVTFDSYQNVRSEVAPGIRVYFKNKEIAAQAVPDLRTDKFVDVLIELDADGKLNVTYNDEVIFTNLVTDATNMVGRFALGARVGERADNHFIDDLDIQTHTSQRSRLEKFEPIGDNASPSPMIQIVLREPGIEVNTNSIQLKLDGAMVKPDITKHPGEIQVSYQPDNLLEPGSSHAVALQFSEKNAPTDTNDFSYRFKVTSQVGITK